MKIINYGHACFKIIGKEFSVIFDPYKNGYVPNLRLPLNLKADFLLISHEHDDHNARELITTSKVGQLDYETLILPHDKNNGKDRGMNKIHIVNIDDMKIVHLGDLGVLDILLLKLNDVDVLFAPINGFYTISSEEVVQLINMIKPKVVIPMHYYNASNKSGYPDNNQIEIFKNLVKDYKEINDYQIEINKGDKGVFIFNEYLN
jgi:L-ascorbate metabolism protein UlaG (beta-lactamase superfamily)